jgi:hypothetical protein
MHERAEKKIDPPSITIFSVIDNILLLFEKSF